ncbi:MAG: Unknown protein [uncultured Sulfurovum sp.]|uniref:O-antigen ligase-related domain-containing protein n=1 Tax=uncultured Sulfurovum sp. TaxID=269237 RepID=A0A6S6SYI4_9BACT|nr:MAG: Unknown protein [uncultured Sulfurovum sp.]
MLNSFFKNHTLTLTLLVSFVLWFLFHEPFVTAAFGVMMLLSFYDAKKYLPYVLPLFSIMLFLNEPIGFLTTNLWNIGLVLIFAFFALKNHFLFDKLEIVFFAILFSFLITSALGSPLFSIAVFKVVSLLILTYPVFKAYQNTTIKQSTINQIIEAIIIANFILYFTSHGYFRNGLFMGIFNHSQSIGIFLVPLLTYYTISYFEREDLTPIENIYRLFITSIGFIELLATYSRTAIFTYLLLVATYLVFNKFNVKEMLKTLLQPFRLVVALIIIIIIGINIPTIYNKAQNYIFKSYSSSSFNRQADSNILGSRERLFTESMNNFLKHPLQGNGFGVMYVNGTVAPNPLKINAFFDAPYSMVDYEKGNTYLTVLEEGGIITFLLFIYFIYLYLKEVRHYLPGFYASLVIFVMLNGEATFFTLNGSGAFQFIFLVMIYYLVKNKTTDKTTNVFDQRKT